MLKDFNAEKIDWEKGNGLVPAVIQDAGSGQVLMVGFMNKESLAKTIETGYVTFFSRTKNRLWKKGETSGNVLAAKEIRSDCDNDTLLILADASGCTCHTGSTSCFGEDCGPDISFLLKLEQILDDRIKKMPEGSYTAKLVKKGIPRIAQKVGEEAIETALSAATGADNFLEEAADLMYHLLLLLRIKNKNIKDVVDVLAKRDKK